MEGVEHHRARRVPGPLDHFERQFDGVEFFDKPQEFHGGANTERQAEFEQFAVMSSPQLDVGSTSRGAGDDMPGPNRRRLPHASGTLVPFGPLAGTGRLEPALEINGGGDLQPFALDRGANIGERASLREMGVDIVVPKFDGAIARPTGDLDLLEDGDRTNRARIEAVEKVGHGGEEKVRGLALPRVVKAGVGLNMCQASPSGEAWRTQSRDHRAEWQEGTGGGISDRDQQASSRDGPSGKWSPTRRAEEGLCRPWRPPHKPHSQRVTCRQRISGQLPEACEGADSTSPVPGEAGWGDHREDLCVRWAGQRQAG